MDTQPKIDFEKMDGLVAGIVQDAATGEVLMLGFLNPESYAKTLETRLCDLLEPHAAEAVDEGRDQRQPPARGLGRDRLRQRRAAVPGGGGRRWAGVPRGHGELLYASRLDLRARRGGEPWRNKLRLGIAEGQPAGCDHCAVQARGLEHLRGRAVVFSVDRRCGD